MRIEENPRAECFNIYVDTDSEYNIMKTMMSTPSPDLKRMTKLHSNSLYGKAVTNMNRDYICVMVDNNPTVIFKDKIVAIEKRGEKANIHCVFDAEFYTDNKYADVIKMLV